MEDKRSADPGESHGQIPEQNKPTWLIGKIGSYFIDKVKDFIESQETEIDQTQRQMLHNNQTNEKIS